MTRRKRDYEQERRDARPYVVRVHRGPIEPRVTADLQRAGITPRQLPEMDLTVTVRASRDGLAMSAAAHATWREMPTFGQTVTYYEQLPDGTERELFHGA